MYYSNLDEKNMTDNGRFWKANKSVLSGKWTHKEKNKKICQGFEYFLLEYCSKY